MFGAKVERLFLRSNWLSGTLPPRMLSRLPALKELVLGENQISGSLPATLADMAGLEKLVLWNNKLEGAVPAALSGLTALTELRLSNTLGWKIILGTVMAYR